MGGKTVQPRQKVSEVNFQEYKVALVPHNPSHYPGALVKQMGFSVDGTRLFPGLHTTAAVIEYISSDLSWQFSGDLWR